MKEMICAIRKRMGYSQEELANQSGIAYATVNRWENGHSKPTKAAQLRLYELCRQKGVQPEEIVRMKLQQVLSGIQAPSGQMLLYHGSKAGLVGDIAPISRSRCDFGSGFYMGTDPQQPLTLVCDFEKSKFYAVALDVSGLCVLRIQPDLEWAMFVAFHRGKMEDIKETAFYRRYSEMADNCDLIVGSITNDRMFFVLDNFFQGNITDQALVKSLSALQLGEQYVAISQKACAQVTVLKEIELSHLERTALRDMSEANRITGVRLANTICRDYRRTGRFFDEILEDAVNGRDLDGQHSTETV